MSMLVHMYFNVQYNGKKVLPPLLWKNAGSCYPSIAVAYVGQTVMCIIICKRWMA